MSTIKFRLEIHGVVDTLEYPVPADGRLMLQLKEDIQEAIETTIPVEINAIKIVKVISKNDDEVRDYN